jgi:hypothetical protein
VLPQLLPVITTMMFAMGEVQWADTPPRRSFSNGLRACHMKTSTLTGIQMMLRAQKLS